MSFTSFTGSPPDQYRQNGRVRLWNTDSLLSSSPTYDVPTGTFVLLNQVQGVIHQTFPGGTGSIDLVVGGIRVGNVGYFGGPDSPYYLIVTPMLLLPGDHVTLDTVFTDIDGTSMAWGQSFGDGIL